MQFRIAKKVNENIHKYPTTDLRIAHDFSLKLKGELGDFLVAVVVFGSAARRQATSKSDLDVLIVNDDLSFKLTPELINSYSIIVQNLIAQTALKIHVTSMTYTSFWDFVRIGDAVVMNVLRDGVALLDRGLFEPLQELLRQGKIKPSEEAVWRYYGRAPRTLLNSKWHILQATVDLYWAVIDAAHAALMKNGQLPTIPERVAEVLHEHLGKKGKLEKKYVGTMKKFYDIHKKITHRDIKEIRGEEYDKLAKEAHEFVTRMREFVG